MTPADEAQRQQHPAGGGDMLMTPAGETPAIAPMPKPPRLHSRWQALASMRQGLRTRCASAYVRVQERVVEIQEVIGRAGREAVIRLQPLAAIVAGQLRDPLMWLRFVALLCMLMGGLLRMAEPDTWLGHLFASRFEAVKAGYRTLGYETRVNEGDGWAMRIVPLTRNAPGFQEILELALASHPSVTNYIAQDQIGPIETIHAWYRRIVPLGWHSLFIAPPEDWQGKPVVDRVFRAPIRIRLEDGQGKSVVATLDYTEAEIKGRFFMPRLRWWALLAVWGGFIINVLLLFINVLLLFPGSRRSYLPMREK